MYPSLSFQGKEIASDYLGPQIANAPPFPQWFKHEEMLSHETPGPDIQWRFSGSTRPSHGSYVGWSPNPGIVV